MNQLADLIPLNKFDCQRAEAAIATGYPEVEPILPELLTWLQDYNWPVAQVLAPFLASIGAPLIPHVRMIMATDDQMWRYWMIVLFMRDSVEVAEAFRDELTRIAYMPNPSEIEAEMYEEAAETLRIHAWMED